MADRISKEELFKEIQSRLEQDYQCSLKQANKYQLHDALSRVIMGVLAKDWRCSQEADRKGKTACYFSAEFLVGRAIYNNLVCLNIQKEVEEVFQKSGLDFSMFEDIEDAALGNGGLGRLAACFLDSAAAQDLPLNGYGIRYRFGLFKQTIENGYQREYADDWSQHGDPWSIRREAETVRVVFADETVNAVPYDMPIVGYGTRNIGTLRLWQAEPLDEFDFTLFNDQQYEDAVKAKNNAENISRVLYPNDSTEEGKILRLKQQYFFCSASLQSIIKEFQKTHNSDFSRFSEWYAVQLNDTHPVIGIPEFIRIMVDCEGVPFIEAFNIAQKTFSYTNHTIMAEALEKWSLGLMQKVCPRILEIIWMIGEHLERFLNQKHIPLGSRKQYRIISDGMVHMARLAIYAGHTINGVAEIHTEIIKKSALHEWYTLFPERFQNKTNGVTQRRWLLLCNPDLSSMITRLLGSSDWVLHLEKLKGLEWFADDPNVLNDFLAIKQKNKAALAQFIEQHDGIRINETFIFDIQVKRLHEYKRQFLNALSILDLYYGLKEGSIENFTPTVFIFGAKSAPGYARAKAIIHFICEIAQLINNDPDMKDKMQVVFVQNYNVSYAEKLVCSADVSEQISTAGTEASGTSNMKFMLNGTVTMGTYDGANVEIVREAGEENNYIFGARVEELDKIRESYNPKELYKGNLRIKRVLDTLIDGTFSDNGDGEFEELYNAILKGASWHKPDHYFLLHDFDSYQETRLRFNQDYRDRLSYAKKCWLNMANAGIFSSDRTIRQYADEIWNIKPVQL